MVRPYHLLTPLEVRMVYRVWLLGKVVLYSYHWKISCCIW